MSCQHNRTIRWMTLQMEAQLIYYNSCDMFNMHVKVTLKSIAKTWLDSSKAVTLCHMLEWERSDIKARQKLLQIWYIWQNLHEHEICHHSNTEMCFTNFIIFTSCQWDIVQNTTVTTDFRHWNIILNIKRHQIIFARRKCAIEKIKRKTEKS